MVNNDISCIGLNDVYTIPHPYKLNNNGIR